jgi:hypothetical protein
MNPTTCNIFQLTKKIWMPILTTCIELLYNCNATSFALISNVHKMQHNTQNYDFKQKKL